MHASAYRKGFWTLGLLGAVLVPLAPASAETVMQQCGQQYQAAKAGNTLNGMTWNQYRTDCAARLKATPAAATDPVAANPLKPTPAAATAAPAPAAPAAPAATPAPAAPAAPATTTAAGKPVSPGRAAETARIKTCGAEWKANKATLVAATPGLKWPQYWHTCSARLKAAGQ